MDLPAPPVFNGQCLADGRLLVSLEDGRLLCVGSVKRARTGRPFVDPADPADPVASGEDRGAKSRHQAGGSGDSDSRQ
jgi:hypothetical protein